MAPGISGKTTQDGREQSELGQILVIEDEPAVLEVIQEVISDLGYLVNVARDGTLGLLVYRRLFAQCVCVILDYSVPGMDPQRLLAEFREIDQSVPVLLSSGYDKRFIERYFPLENVQGFLAKPFEPRQLQDAVRGILLPTDANEPLI